MHSLRLCLLAALCLSGPSCAHKVGYFLGDEDVYLGPRVPMTLRVNPLKDTSPKSKRINLSVSGEIWRINGENGYRSGETLAEGVTRMVADHLEHSTLFHKVYGPEDPLQPGDTIDLELDGTIHDYVAMGQVKHTPETATLVATTFLSLPGALLSTALSSPVKTTVQTGLELRNLRVRDAATDETLWYRVKIGRQETAKDHWMQADAPKLYKRIDNELRLLMNQIVEELASSAEMQELIPEENELADPGTLELGG